MELGNLIKPDFSKSSNNWLYKVIQRWDFSNKKCINKKVDELEEIIVKFQRF